MRESAGGSSDLLVVGIQDQHADKVLSGSLQVKKLSGSFGSAFIVMTRSGVVLDGQRKHLNCLLVTPENADTHK